MHSHVLPGIDDGAPDAEISVELIKGLKDLGYQKLIASPHILWDMFKNDDNTIGTALEEAKKNIKVEGIDIELKAAAEYYMDEHFDELVRTETPLRCIKDNIVLVEFSFVSPPLGLKEKLFDLQVRGYQPVIAHPERYLYFSENKKWYNEIVHAGCFLQINLLSLTGYYGKGSLELAKYISSIDTKRSILFTLYSAEEMGLVGSAHLAQRLKEENLDLYVMFNIEMVGIPMNDKDYLAYITGFELSNLAVKFNEYSGDKVVGFLPQAKEYQLFKRSDNYPFYKEFGIPAQTISTFDFTNYDYYHHVKDEFEEMDVPFLTQLIEDITPGIVRMANSESKEIKMNE